MDLSTEEITNKYGLACAWPAIDGALNEYAAQEAKSYQSWLNNQVLHGRTQHKLWLDYKAEVLDQRPTPSVSLLQEGAAPLVEEVEPAVAARMARKAQSGFAPTEATLPLSQYQQERGGRPTTPEYLKLAADLIEEDCKPSSYAEAMVSGLRTLATKLEATPTPVAIEEGGGWISVEERLPVEDRDGTSDYVLVANGVDDVLVAYCRFKSLTWCEREDGRPLTGITHWQPLPTAPAKKEAPNG